MRLSQGRSQNRKPKFNGSFTSITEVTIRIMKGGGTKTPIQPPEKLKVKIVN